MNAGLKAERQRRIARLLAQRAVTSQQELVGLLAATGQPATQATVSRDLEELGAYKVRRNGHVVYALPAGTAPGSVPGPGGDSLRRLLAGSVGDVAGAGAPRRIASHSAEPCSTPILSATTWLYAETRYEWPCTSLSRASSAVTSASKVPRYVVSTESFAACKRAAS